MTPEEKERAFARGKQFDTTEEAIAYDRRVRKELWKQDMVKINKKYMLGLDRNQIDKIGEGLADIHEFVYEW